MPGSQDKIFLNFEGDRWFERNQEGLSNFDPQSDLPCRLIETHGLKPKDILEIGASNGARLAAIGKCFQARLVAVEPSLRAIADGENKFPEVEFVQGVASNIPVKGVFELVIVNFVFHWIDRSTLLRSVSEIDRTVADGGFLIIGDFLPLNPTKVIYHHLPNEGVYTYKQDYSKIFIDSGLYRQVDLLKGDHSCHSPKGHVSETDRVGVWLLQKVLQD